MCPEAAAMEIQLVEAIALLDLALLAGGVVATGVDALNTQAIDLCTRDLATPDRGKVAEMLTLAMQLHFTANDTLGRIRPLIETFVTAQKAALRGRTNVQAMQ
ncbi:MAG: hypothetical protein ACOYNZ_15705 [Rhodoferax sp.]